jgi:predicted dehydrogenase
MRNPLEVMVLGAGGRGTYAYAPYALAHPDEIQITAVADPNPERRARFAAMHEIEPERQFTSWEEAMTKGQLTPALINCTQDQMHVPSTLAALNAGYDVLLEKPMAPTPDACRLLVNTAERLGRTLQICHVLRYTRFFSKLHEIVSSGRLGRIITIDHRENVSFWHMSHSFVRGNWRNEALSSPMILAKCCHDMDILVWIMNRQVTQLNSFGSLTHYRPESAPPGVPKHCTDGCPIAESCPWYAPRLYGAEPGNTRFNAWMVGAMGGGDTPEQRLERLKQSPYSRCVYHCDNNVVDHQVINMLFDDDATCTFTMHGHSDSEGRSMRYDGTRATLFGDFFDTQVIRIRDHGSQHEEVIDLTDNESGHGGGDEGIMRDFVRTMRGQPSPHTTSARVSLESHLLCFAAEQSRHEKRVIDMQAYREV